jgi:hypothetical protein
VNSFTYIVNKDDGYSFIIRQLDNEYFVTYLCEGEPLYYFKDIYDPNKIGNNTFIRIINDIELYYHKGKCYIIN